MKIQCKISYYIISLTFILKLLSEKLDQVGQNFYFLDLESDWKTKVDAKKCPKSAPPLSTSVTYMYSVQWHEHLTFTVWKSFPVWCHVIGDWHEIWRHRQRKDVGILSPILVGLIQSICCYSENYSMYLGSFNFFHLIKP